MSLFGDNALGAESPPDSEFGSSKALLAQSPCHHSRHHSPDSAQSAPEAIPFQAPDFDGTFYTNSESDSEESGSEAPTRPNRFVGHPQTWKSYTEADRQIAASLDQIRDSDLAAHLYNAHALKRRSRRPARDVVGLENWRNRDDWLKKGSETQYTDISGLSQTELVPSKDWTAWPLPLAKLSSLLHRTTRSEDNGGRDEWAVGGVEIYDAGDELREELLATFVRLAKEKWRSREPEDVTHRGRQHTAVSRSRSRSKSALSTKSRRTASRNDVEMKDDEGIEGIESMSSRQKRGRKFEDESFSTPAFLADDKRAHQLLQPTIESMLARLDNVALAVRRNRQNHFGRGGSSERSSQSEFTSGAESTGPGSRSSSKGASSKTSKEKTNARPSFRATSRSTSKDEGTQKRVRSESTASEDSAASGRDWSSRAGLLDWSEVLGLAAVQGWDERAIARTAHRCTALFGESMSFLLFDGKSASISVREPVHYRPSTIPGLEVVAKSRPRMPKRPLFQTGTLRCPHKDCFGYEKDLALPYRVIEHCIRVHGYDPRMNDSDNEERMVGGVHIDGFLQPVTVKPGSLGRGRSKAGKAGKKQKIEREVSSASNAIQNVQDSTESETE